MVEKKPPVAPAPPVKKPLPPVHRPVTPPPPRRPHGCYPVMPKQPIMRPVHMPCDYKMLKHMYHHLKMCHRYEMKMLKRYMKYCKHKRHESSSSGHESSSSSSSRHHHRHHRHHYGSSSSKRYRDSSSSGHESSSSSSSSSRRYPYGYAPYRRPYGY